MKSENRKDIAEKKIYTAPVPVRLDFLSPYMLGSTLKRMDDERMVISQFSFSWIELLLGILWLWLYISSITNLNKLADERFAADKRIATKEVFYSYKSYKDSTRTTNIRRVEREPNVKEAEIIARYRELGEKGYRKYLKTEIIRSEDGGWFGYAVLLVFGIVLSFLGLPRRKRFVFDRKAGTVRYPGFLGLWRHKQAFSQVNFIYARAGMYVFERKGLAILHPNGVTRVFINFQYPERFLSFYVWYMDRNRPLPLGTAFDPYRERDYDRRKAAGFPPPLYPSQIDIAEWEGAESPERREEYRKQVELLIKKVKANRERFFRW